MIADYKNPDNTTGAITAWTYLADVKNISNMYPYGKSYGTNAIYNATEDYRYGFNGMEKEKNMDASGDITDFGARVFDANFPMFLSRDRYEYILSSYNPYSLSLNNPIVYFDVNGEFPYTFHTKSFHPDKTFGGGFKGDSRNFSTDPNSSARIAHYFTFDPSNGQTLNKGFQKNFSFHPLGFILSEMNTIQVPSEWFIDEETPTEKQYNVSGSSGHYNIETGYEGSNPLTPSLFTPDIDVNSSYTITENLQAGVLTVKLNVTGDAFPSTESYIVDKEGNSVFIGISQYQGSPLYSLFGDNRRPMINTSISININDEGVFQSINFQSTEISLEDWNNKFTSKSESEGGQDNESE